MLTSSLCGYRNAYILVSGTIIITWAGRHDAARRLDERNKGLIFENCALSTDCINQIYNTQIDNVKYIMLMYNLIEYSDN